MPRPKRTRVASTRGAAPVAKDPNPPSTVAAQTSDPSTNTYDNSDDGAKNKMPSRRESRTGRSATRSTSNPRQIAVIEASRSRRDSALQRLGNITSTTSGNTNTDDDDESDDSSIDVEVGRRAAATPAHGRLAEVSGLDMDDEMFDDLNTTFDTGGPASAQRSQETSTLSVGQFKRRPRAGSFMSRDDLLRPSSRAGPNTPGISSTFNIGMFKRRAREPSILGTAQKPRAERPVPESDSGDKSDDEGEDNDEAERDGSSPPQAGSTPLRRSKRRSGAVEAETDSPQVLSIANPRKRKSTETHEQRPRSSPHAEDDSIAAEESELEVLSSPPSLPNIQNRPSTPLMDEDIAPPASSDSSEGEAEIWPPIQSLAKGRGKRPASALRRTPVRDHENLSDMSSPPSLTYSPNYDEASPPPQRATMQTRRAASKPETKVTTADLTGLLPRRRHRNARADPFAVDDSGDEVDAAGLADDDDELSYLDVRTRRRPARPLSRAGTVNQSATRGRSGQRKGKTPVSTKPARRTYGRSSDKENQDNDDENDDVDPGADDEEVTETSEEMVARIGEELKDAARKFAEVDKWELEYEEMTQSSSPRDAR
jgi:hypothetical protein